MPGLRVLAEDVRGVFCRAAADGDLIWLPYFPVPEWDSNVPVSRWKIEPVAVPYLPGRGRVGSSVFRTENVRNKKGTSAMRQVPFFVWWAVLGSN